MKKIVLLVIAAYVSMTLSAQEHMSFMGISFENNITEFSKQLKNKGFTFSEKIESGAANITVFEGTFAGKYSEVSVASSVKTGTVFKVLVYWGYKYDDWSDIKNAFLGIKESFTTKYGNPNGDYHFFKDPYYEGDGYEMQAIRNNKCNYISFFDAAGGGIIVEISSLQKIQISYEDFINMDKYKSEREDNVIADI